MSLLCSSRLVRGEADLWQNARRYRGGSRSPRPDAPKIPTRTLKEALKHRPPVSAYVREITRASQLDRQRELERRRMERYVVYNLWTFDLNGPRM